MRPTRKLNTKAFTMNNMILRHLVTQGTITNVEAQAMYKCRALPRRICDLKEKGHKIESVIKYDPTGQRYARYYYKGFESKVAQVA